MVWDSRYTYVDRSEAKRVDRESGEVEGRGREKGEEKTLFFLSLSRRKPSLARLAFFAKHSKKTQPAIPPPRFDSQPLEHSTFERFRLDLLKSSLSMTFVLPRSFSY